MMPPAADVKRWGPILGVLLVAAIGVPVALSLRAPQEKLLKAVADAPSRESFSGTVEVTSFGEDSAFAMQFELTHAAPDRTQIRMAGWHRGREAAAGGAEKWSKPEHWFGWWERWLKHGKNAHSPWSGWGASWWRGGSRNIVRPILDPALATRNYHIKEGAEETVAGRPALVLELTPRVADRPSYRLWVDSATSIPLAFEVRGATGEKLVAWRYASFRLGTPAERPPEPSKWAWKPRHRELSSEELKSYGDLEVWTPAALPSGFRFQGARETRWGQLPSLTISYTDGVTVLTVTEIDKEWPIGKISTSEAAPVVERTERAGMTMLRANLGKTRVTVMGQLSSDSLVTLIRSMKGVSR